MSSIDTRIVQMVFDNKQFERGVKQTMGTLDDLNERLNFDEQSKSLRALERAGEDMSFGNLASTLGMLSDKFTMFDAIAVNAMNRIANAALNMGENLVKSLSIDQVSAGMQKYEEKTTSVQTIMNATGRPIEEVNDNLEKLMWFTDQTSYSFTDMASNIGKFTSQNIPLEEAVTAMEGIANWAAVAGQSTGEASRAMYNMSQAIGTGAVKLQDWKSIENANMATKEFKETVIATAKEMGILDKKTGKGLKKFATKEAVTVENFSSTLSSGWFTKDVLMAVLKQYGSFGDEVYRMTQEEIDPMTGKLYEAERAIEVLGEQAENGEDKVLKLGHKAFAAAQEAKTFTDALNAAKDAVSTGWMQSFEHIFGNYEQAKILWTDLANTLWDLFAGGAERRNSILQAWGDLGGRMDIRTIIIEPIEQVISLVETVKEAFRDVFGLQEENNAAAFLFSVTSGIASNIHKVTEWLHTVDVESGVTPLEKIHNISRGIFSIIGYIGKGLGIVWQSTKTIFSYITPILGDSFTKLSNLGVMISNAFDEAQKAGKFEKILTIIQGAIHSIFANLKAGIDYVKNSSFGQLISTIAESLKTFFTMKVDESAGFFGRLAERFKAITALADPITKFFGGLTKIFGGLASIIGSFGSFFVNGIGAIFESLGKSASNLSFDGFMDALNGGLIASILLSIRNLVSGGSIIDEIGKAFLGDDRHGLLGAIGDIVDDVGELFDGLGETLRAFTAQLKAGTLMKIAIAVGILAASMVALSLIDSAKLTVALAAMTGAFAELLGAMKIMSMIKGKGLEKMATAMVGMSVAVLILAFAMGKLADLSWEGLIKGLVGVAGLFAIMIATSTLMNRKSRGMVKGAAGMILFSVALRVLVKAVEQLGALDVITLGKGLVGVGILCTELAASMAIVGRVKFGAGKGIGIILMAASLQILSGVVKNFGGMQWSSIAKGLFGMGMALAAMVAAMNVIPKGAISKSLGILVMSSALLVLSKAFKSVSGMSWTEIGKSLIALGGGLLVMAAAMRVMGKTGVLGGIGMIAAATAIHILVPAMATLGKMKLSTIAKAILALGGGLGVLAAGGYLLTPVVGTIMAISGALSMLALSVGFLLASISAMNVSGAISAIGGSLSGLLNTMNTQAWADLVGGFFDALWNGFLNIISGIGDLAMTLSTTLGELVIAVCEVIKTSAPEIAETVIAVIDSVLASAAEHIPSISDSLFTILIGVIDTLATRVPELVTSVISFFTNLFSAITTAAADNPALTLDSILAALGTMTACFAVLEGASAVAGGALAAIAVMILVFDDVAAVIALLSTLGVDVVVPIADSLALLMTALSGSMVTMSLVPFEAALSGVEGMAVVVGGLSALLIALGGLSQIEGFDYLMSEGAEVLKQIGSAIGGFAGSIVGGFAEGVTDALPAIGKNLSDFMTNAQGFIDGASNISESAASGLGSLVLAIVGITAADVINGLTSWLTGGASMVKFGRDISQLGPYLKTYSDSVKGIDEGAITASANAAQMLSDMSTKLPSNGGFIDIFTGTTMSMSDFGDQLITFGPKLKEYADSVAGIDGDAVNASANAASMLSDMANKMPSNGGFMDWIVGTKVTMTDFGDDLIAFGPKLKEYADSVVGIDGDAVTSSANAASVLGNMASTSMPTEGGVIGFFTGGQKTLAAFGKDLSEFGPHIKSYADSVSGMDASSITASGNAIQVLADMSTNLPNNGNLVSWISGEATLASFGGQIEEFGKHFKAYYDYIGGMAFGRLSNVATHMGTLIDYIRNLTTEKLDTKQAENVAKSAKTIIKTLTEGLVANYKELDSASWNIADWLYDGLTSNFDADTLAYSILSDLATSLDTQRSKFAVGADGLITGLNSTNGMTSASITPVVDMTNVRAASEEINNLLTPQALSANTSTTITAKINPSDISEGINNASIIKTISNKLTSLEVAVRNINVSAPDFSWAFTQGQRGM